jgi:hypothetical protein
MEKNIKTAEDLVGQEIKVGTTVVVFILKSSRFGHKRGLWPAIVKKVNRKNVVLGITTQEKTYDRKSLPKDLVVIPTEHYVSWSLTNL